MHKGVILQPTYRIRGGIPVIQLYGRLESGSPFLVEDDRFRPYFFVRTRDLQHLDSLYLESAREPVVDAQ